MFVPSSIVWQKKLWLLLLIIITACGQQENGRMDDGTTPADNKSPSIEQSNESSQIQEYQGDVTTLRFLSDAWSEVNYYSDLIRAFEADNPDIKIEFVSFDDVLGNDLVGGVELIAKLVSAADVIDNVASPEAVASGLILDLTPLFEEANLNRDDFYSGTLESAQWGGGIWYFPVRISPTVFFYNKDAFDDAGLSYPEAGWSWDDFLATAKALTISSDEEVEQWGFVKPIFTNPLPFIESRIGPLLDLATQPPVIRFDDTAVIDAVRWYTDLISLHEVAPYFPRPEPGEPAYASILIQEGKAAMWIEYLANWAYWRERAQMNVGAVPFPVDLPNAKSTPVRVSGYIVSAGTEKTDAAWRWLLFLSENVPQNGNAFYGGSSSFPARRSIAVASGYWDSVDEEVASVMRYALEHAYTSQPGADAERYIRQAIEAILAEGEVVETALFEVQVQAEADFEEMMVEVDSVDDFTDAPSEAQTPLGEGVTAIDFMIIGSFSDEQLYQSLATEFQELHPDIAVKIGTPDGANVSSSLQNMANGADCFQWSGQLDEGELDAVISLNPLLDVSSNLRSGDFLPTTLDPFTYQGQLWGVPGHFSVSVIAFNKALFDRADIPYPEAAWTTEQMLELAIALTIGDGETSKQYGYLPSSFVASDLHVFLDLLGAQLVDEGQSPPLLTLNNSATIAAMGWYTALATEYAVMPPLATDINDPGAWQQQRGELIENGRAAMWLVSNFDPIGTNGTLDVGFVPLPISQNGARSYQSTTGYFISANTEMVQPCWEWITFLVAQPMLGAGNFTVPALRSAAESAVYWQAVGEERAAANLNTLNNISQKPLLQRFSGEDIWLTDSYWWLAQAYEQVLQDGLTVEDALTVAQEKADAYWQCLIANNGFNNEDQRQACLRQTNET